MLDHKTSWKPCLRHAKAKITKSIAVLQCWQNKVYDKPGIRKDIILFNCHIMLILFCGDFGKHMEMHICFGKHMCIVAVIYSNYAH